MPPAPEEVVREIPIEDIVLCDELQPREKMNNETVIEYIEAIEQGVNLPPATLFNNGGQEFWMTDGFHRFQSWKKSGRKTIPAIVKTGSKRDALLWSVGANAAHGLRRTNADKRRAAMTLLKDKEWTKWSDGQIAKQCAVNKAIGNVCAIDGAISKAVKSVVADAVGPLVAQVNDLTTQITGKKAAEAAVSNTTLKGTPYEAEIVERLQPWARCVGAEIEHVGGDNKPGDITIKLTDLADPTSKLLLVLEVRDRQDQKGGQVVAQELLAKMVSRGAGAAVYLSRYREGLAKSLGEWAEGVCDRGPWVACTEEHLTTAIRFLFVQWRVAQKRTLTPTLDASAAVDQIRRIRAALGRIKNIKTNATAVRESAGKIDSEADLLRDEVRNSLCDLEDSMGIRQSAAVQVTTQ